MFTEQRIDQLQTAASRVLASKRINIERFAPETEETDAQFIVTYQGNRFFIQISLTDRLYLLYSDFIAGKTVPSVLAESPSILDIIKSIKSYRAVNPEKESKQ